MLNLTKIQFLIPTYSESNSNDHLHPEVVQTKFNIGTVRLDNHHQCLATDRSLGSMCPGLPESNSRLARASTGQCLKFYDNTPSVATLLTLNNPQDLDPDILEASFPVQ